MMSISRNCCIVILLVGVLYSCTSSYKNIDPSSINLAICDIDSTVAALHGFEPKENPDVGYPGVEQPVQETYDTARKTWEEFKAKCFKQDYKGAYKLYSDKEKQGDFLVFLRHSSARIQFDRYILGPLFYEYEEESVADSLYIDALSLEYALESFAMKQSIGNTDYIPEDLPALIFELGCLMSQTGRLDEALELIDDFTYAVRGKTGDEVLTKFATTYAISIFYVSADQMEDVVNTLEQYKEYSTEHIDMFKDQEEYEHYMMRAEDCIQSLKEEAGLTKMEPNTQR